MNSGQDQFILFGAYYLGYIYTKKKRKNIVYSDFKCNWDPAIYLLTRVILVIKAKNVCPRLGETRQHMLHWETRAAWINRKSLSPASGTQWALGKWQVVQSARSTSLQPRQDPLSLPRPWLRPSRPERIQYIYSVKRGSFFFLNEWKNTPLKNSVNGELPLCFSPPFCTDSPVLNALKCLWGWRGVCSEQSLQSGRRILSDKP